MMHPYYIQQIARQEQEQREADARLYHLANAGRERPRRRSAGGWLRQLRARLACRLQGLESPGCAA